MTRAYEPEPEEGRGTLPPSKIRRSEPIDARSLVVG